MNTLADEIKIESGVGRRDRFYIFDHINFILMIFLWLFSKHTQCCCITTIHNINNSNRPNMRSVWMIMACNRLYSNHTMQPFNFLVTVIKPLFFRGSAIKIHSIWRQLNNVCVCATPWLTKKQQQKHQQIFQTKKREEKRRSHNWLTVKTGT